MKIPRITGTSPTAPPDGFLPYVYGAASGRPSKGRPEKVLLHLSSLAEGLTELGVIAPERTAPRPRTARDWESAERARLDAARCPECQALPPNHLVACGLIPMPDLTAERCGCEYVKGSLGCRLTHGGAA
ncbi:MAG TPA: hypothetical protein VNH17_22795 [Streptosporangiaceae bacterium]|nr:hypothetical protein [Streptosporangiaceae bacterium]